MLGICNCLETWGGSCPQTPCNHTKGSAMRHFMHGITTTPKDAFFKQRPLREDDNNNNFCDAQGSP